MDFQDVSQLYEELDNKARDAMVQLAKEIKQGMEELIRDKLYGSYDAQVYKRSYELYNAISIDVLQESVGSWYLDISISDSQHGSNPTWIGDNSSYSEIFGKFAEDGFYKRNGSIDIMRMTEEEWIEMGKAMGIIKKYLSQWFDFK